MPTPRDDAEEMRKAEREIGKNIPEGMKGLDTADLADADEDEGPGPHSPRRR